MFQESTTEPQITYPNRGAKGSTSDKNIVTAAKGGAILFSGELFTYFTGFLFIARFLGAEQFGLYLLSNRYFYRCRRWPLRPGWGTGAVYPLRLEWTRC